MDFIKMHGLGNDFIVWDQLSNEGTEDFSSIAIKLCHRNFGIGADGLVVLLPSDKADLTMRIFNPDGSEAEMCGNASRCVAKYMYDKQQIPNRQISIDTLAGIIHTEIIDTEGKESKISVNMGRPVLLPDAIPVNLEGDPNIVDRKVTINEIPFEITSVSMGNPHCVIFVPSVEDVPLDRWGPMIEKSTLFPAHTNVEFVEVLSTNLVKVKVWERGAGATLACGTGACAVVVSGVLSGRTARKTKVMLPGGELEIHWCEKSGEIFMSGTAEYVFEGRLIT